ncbi:MAG: type III-B CRISPR module-associated protein Cmr3 [Chloroflexota bacterium]|nr:MAG: type III-B CRISPR module-associated protein Cmr3 [Chloroflexota bacterium]
MQWVFIQALDVWMFRDSKPFSAGQNFYARSLFPPQPGTMQGVIRSHYLERAGTDFRAYAANKLDTEVGTPSSMGKLRITGPFVAKRENGKLTRYLPLPLDVIHGEQLLSPASSLPYQTNAPFEDWRPLVPKSGSELKKETDGEYWLDEDSFAAYLKGNMSQVKLTKAADLYQREERTGLGMDHRRRAHAESLLYRAQFVRPCEDVGLLVGLTVDVFAGQTGTLGIGGEGRSGTYEVLKNYSPPNSAPKEGNIKVVLLTPAWFGDGWQPAGGWSPWVGTDAKLVSMALGRPLALSGWDLARRQPKPLRHFVPAGSVFFFEGAQLTGQPFTESPAGDLDYGAMGYGAYAAGSWNYV